MGSITHKQPRHWWDDPTRIRPTILMDTEKVTTRGGASACVCVCVYMHMWNCVCVCVEHNSKCCMASLSGRPPPPPPPISSLPAPPPSLFEGTFRSRRGQRAAAGARVCQSSRSHKALTCSRSLCAVISLSRFQFVPRRFWLKTLDGLYRNLRKESTG